MDVGAESECSGSEPEQAKLGASEVMKAAESLVAEMNGRGASTLGPRIVRGGFKPLAGAGTFGGDLMQP